MPVKHIPEDIWRKIEKETVKAVIELRETVKEGRMLNWIILRGLRDIEPEDYRELIKKSEKS